MEVSTPGSKRDRKTVATTVPMTATPRTPPNSRTTLLIELAIEACWGATEDIDVVVAGAMTNPIPAPTSAMIAARIPNGAYLSAAIDRTNSPADMTARPVAIELRTPNRPTIRSLLEATVAITIANGTAPTPATNGP